MEQFFNYLKSIGIDDAPDVAEVIFKLKPERIFDIAVECYTLTETSRPKKCGGGLFNFSVSSSISGGISPCSDISCRINNSTELAIFGALYAESIHIPNPFEHIYSKLDDGFSFENEDQLYFFINRFVGDIMLLLYFKELFEEGIFVIKPQTVVTCQACWDKHKKDQKGFEKKFESIKKSLLKDVNKNTSFSIDKTGSLIIGGTEGYTGSEVMKFIVQPKSLKPYMKKLPYSFSEEEVVKLGLFEPILSDALEDILAQKYFMNNSNTTYLTNRGIDSDIIKYIDFDKTTEEGRQEKLMMDGLSHDLPFIQNATLASVLKVRREEEEAFSVYRNAIREAMKSAKNEDVEKNIKEIKQDIIDPALSKIELQMRNHRDRFKSKIKEKLSFNTMILSGGMFANNFIGLSMEEIIAFGGLHTANEIYSDFKERKRTLTEVKNSDFYFMWKVSQISKKG